MPRATWPSSTGLAAVTLRSDRGPHRRGARPRRPLPAEHGRARREHLRHDRRGRARRGRATSSRTAAAARAARRACSTRCSTARATTSPWSGSRPGRSAAATRRSPATVREEMDAWQRGRAGHRRGGRRRRGEFETDDAASVAWQLLGMIDGLNAHALVRWEDAADRGSRIGPRRRGHARARRRRARGRAQRDRARSPAQSPRRGAPARFGATASQASATTSSRRRREIVVEAHEDRRPAVEVRRVKKTSGPPRRARTSPPRPRRVRRARARAARRPRNGWAKGLPDSVGGRRQAAGPRSIRPRSIHGAQREGATSSQSGQDGEPSPRTRATSARGIGKVAADPTGFDDGRSPMYLVGGTVVTSASDLKKASECEFAFLRELDAKLGRDALFEPDGATRCSSAPGGWATRTRHACSRRYRDEFGDGVVEIERPDLRDADQLAAAVAATREAFASGAPRGVPGHLRRRRLHRLRRLHRAPARRPLPRAGLEARAARAGHGAAAARGLRRAARPLGVPRADTVELLLGDGVDQRAPARRHPPVYRLPARGSSRSSPSASPTTARSSGATPATRSTAAAPRATSRCRRTATCCSSPACGSRSARASSTPASHDRRARGIRRPGRRHARRHARGPARPGAAAARGRGERPRGRGIRAALARRPAAAAARRRARAGSLAAIPEPDAGDLFFDFEGDPLYTEGAGDRLGASTTCSA